MASAFCVPTLIELSAHSIIKYLNLESIFDKNKDNCTDPTLTLNQICYLGDIQLGKNKLAPQGSYDYSRITTLNILKTKPFNKDLNILRQVPNLANYPNPLLRLIRNELIVLHVEGYVEAHVTNGPWPIVHPNAYSYRLRPLIRAYNNDIELKLLYSNLYHLDYWSDEDD